MRLELEAKQLEWAEEKQQLETELSRVYSLKSEGAKDREILELRRKLNEMKSNEKMLKAHLKKANDALELERKKSVFPHRKLVGRNDSPWKNSRSGTARSPASLDRSASGSCKSRGANIKPAKNPRAPTPKKSKTGHDAGVPRPQHSKQIHSKKESSDVGRESNNSRFSSSKLSYESSKSGSKVANRPPSPGLQQKRAVGGLKSRSVSQEKRRQTPGKAPKHALATEEGRREDSVELRRNRMLKRKIREDEPVIATKTAKPVVRRRLS